MSWATTTWNSGDVLTAAAFNEALADATPQLSHTVSITGVTSTFSFAGGAGGTVSGGGGGGGGIIGGDVGGGGGGGGTIWLDYSSVIMWPTEDAVREWAERNSYQLVTKEELRGAEKAVESSLGGIRSLRFRD